MDYTLTHRFSPMGLVEASVQHATLHAVHASMQPTALSVYHKNTCTRECAMVPVPLKHIRM